MAKDTIPFESFLMEVHPAFVEDVTEMDSSLLQSGCTRKVESARSGYRASYSANKRALLNFVFRKNGLHARVYGENIAAYADFPATMPESMLAAVAKSPDCKKLTLGPDACAPNCSMGYEFTVDGTLYQKCRYNCFLFHVNDESLPYIKALVEKELTERSA